jgi:hypothetical protein
MPNLILFVLSLPRSSSSDDGSRSLQAARWRVREYVGLSPRRLKPATTMRSKDEETELERKTTIHEQVPNTNIKFICPEFKEKMLYAESRRFMNFGPTPTSTSFGFCFYRMA